MNFRCVFIVLLVGLLVVQLPAQQLSNQLLYFGVVAQQTHKLYNENGFTVAITSPKLLDNALFLNFSVLSSRIGSAFSSNAIQQDNFVVGAHYHFFKQNKLQPVVGFNTGLFIADYQEAIFRNLSTSQLLFAFETGIYYQSKMPVSLKLSGGYNFITTAGTMFPVFYKLALMYRIK